LNVDRRRLTRDGHRFLHRSQAQLRVDRRREIRWEVDAVLNERLEALKREAHLVDTGTQIDNRISSLRIADGRAGLLEERGAGCFYRDARHHGAARVFDEPGDGALGRGPGGKEQENDGYDG